MTEARADRLRCYLMRHDSKRGIQREHRQKRVCPIEHLEPNGSDRFHPTPLVAQHSGPPGRVLFTVMLWQCPDALAPGLAVCVNASNAAASALREPALVFRPGLTLSDFCHKDHLLRRQQAQDTVHFTACE
ncbi:hypothetical protein AOLI_G00306820 [Acnodon oligacanthus]